MGARQAIESDIHELVSQRRLAANDTHTARVLAFAVAAGLNLVEPAAAQLTAELSALGDEHPAHDALHRLAEIAAAWLREAARALDSDRPVDALRALSSTACDAVDDWSRVDGRQVYRALAVRWPWPAARRLIDSLVASDEIIAIATGAISDEYLRRAATSRQHAR